MKKCIAAVLLFLGSMVCASHAQTDNTWQILHSDAKEHLMNLINIDTSEPDPDELKAARYIYKQFNKNGIDWDILSPPKVAPT